MERVKIVYLLAWRFALRAPLLFIIPAIFEFGQHIAEKHIGFYKGIHHAREVAESPLRLSFGFLKVLALGLPNYWFVRYVIYKDAARATRIEMPAIGLWFITFFVSSALAGLSLFGPGWGVLGLDGAARKIVAVTVEILNFVLPIYLTAWLVGWALGNRALGPIASWRIMRGNFWATIGIEIACVGPLMIVHYALGYAAMAVPTPVVWGLLVLDAVVVAFLALTMAGANAIAAERAAERRKVALDGCGRAGGGGVQDTGMSLGKARR